MAGTRSQLRTLAAVGALATTALGCASASHRAQLADRVQTRAAADSGVALLECVHRASAERGYTPLERANESRFRRVDAEGNDGQWFVAEIGRNLATRTLLVAESWVDSTARPQLFVTAYETDGKGIIAVEPGLEKNRRLGAQFQPRPPARALPLGPDVTADLNAIRAACGAQSS